MKKKHFMTIKQVQKTSSKEFSMFSWKYSQDF